LDVGRERAITSNTVMLYSSAPSFGQGVIDPIEAISALGVKYGVGTYPRLKVS
jgi:sphinganine-1-phosphate aldolase